MTAPALYIPHGGGPLPLLNDPGHDMLTAFLRGCPDLFERPRAILVVSAHWEAPICNVQSGALPDMYYDYSGFPEESYRLRYPASGDPSLADEIAARLEAAGFSAQLDKERGFDHGLFVPLLLMYPEADIPCLQVSLLDSMDAAQHIALGRALASLREDGVMILGSGSPFHNMQAFKDGAEGMERCETFDDWLGTTCCATPIDQAAARLTNWAQAPEARYAHPREEHLLPLQVCFGAAMDRAQPAERIFNGDVMGYRMSAFLWQ